MRIVTPTIEMETETIVGIPAKNVSHSFPIANGIAMVTNVQIAEKFALHMP